MVRRMYHATAIFLSLAFVLFGYLMLAGNGGAAICLAAVLVGLTILGAADRVAAAIERRPGARADTSS